jgi:hypothetical protein
MEDDMSTCAYGPCSTMRLTGYPYTTKETFQSGVHTGGSNDYHNMFKSTF